MKTIGIIGGGQLGLMLAEAAAKLGARTICLDPSTDAPARQACSRHIVAAFDDASALRELADASDVVTYEFENIPAEALALFGDKIKQGTRQLFDSQDRLREKSNARGVGLPTAGFAAVADEMQLDKAIGQLGYPCVLKSRTMGYDGHGQLVLRSEADRGRALAMLDCPCILEEFIPFDFEASVVMVRRDDGSTVHFPVGRNTHRDGILDVVEAPLADTATADRLIELTARLMTTCDYRGILAVEYFIRGGDIYFNEMAPRPHNSAHWTIEGCSVSQFEAAARYLLGLEIPEPRLTAKEVVMKNILGADMPWAVFIPATETSHPHFYGKTDCKPKRKMGHWTLLKK